MALAFRSVTIPGIWGELRLGDWAVQASRTQYHGQAGESEIRGARGGRDLAVEGVWKNAYSTAALLEAAIEALNAQAPINGTIARTGNIIDSYQNCTLLGVKIKQGPLPSTQHGWFAIVEIRWRQLGT